MTNDRVRVSRSTNAAQVRVVTDYVRTSARGDTAMEIDLGFFIKYADIPALIAGLQAASDDEEAEFYSDSELVGSPREES